MNIKRKIMIAICLMAAVMSEAVEKYTASINKVLTECLTLCSMVSIIQMPRAATLQSEGQGR